MDRSEQAIRRIVVALNAGPDYHAPLQRGAALARALGAELGVLFIEDVNLFRLCELPMAHIVGGRARRHLEARALERELRVRAQEARASLERIAEVAELSWSFRVWRGRAREAVHEAARQADLVSLSRTLRSWPLPAPARARPPRPLPAQAPILAFYETGRGGEAALRVVDVAARVASAASLPLTIVAPRAGGSVSQGQRRAIEARLAASGVVPHWRMVRPTRQAIMRLVRAAAPRLFVLDAQGGAVAGGLLDEMLYASGAEALLVSGESDTPALSS